MFGPTLSTQQDCNLPRHSWEHCTHRIWHLQSVVLVVTEVLHHLGAVPDRIKMLISSVLIFDLLLHESPRQEKVSQVDINEVDYKV